MLDAGASTRNRSGFGLGDVEALTFLIDHLEKILAPIAGERKRRARIYSTRATILIPYSVSKQYLILFSNSNDLTTGVSGAIAYRVLFLLQYTSHIAFHNAARFRFKGQGFGHDCPIEDTDLACPAQVCAQGT